MNPPPVLDTSLADEFFTAGSTDENAQLREMMTEFVADITPRLAQLHRHLDGGEETAFAIRRALHQLRGVVANFACTAAAARLHELEQDWGTLDGDTKKKRLQAAEVDLQAGIAALRNRYPFLN